jgi:2-C-methyl-D-erythritol 2,4-cyclodiphosphate synthase
LLCIHDAARPCFDPGLLNEAFRLAARCGAVVFGRPASDTIKQVDETDQVVATLDRRRIWAAQTPQIFKAGLLREGYAAFGPDAAFTDEASMVERLGHPVTMVPANPGNIKMTHPEDFVEYVPAAPHPLRMGHGYDVHRFDPARPLVLCGVTLPEGPGLLGHSDADVALHALMDAILGAVGEGDIGQWFPDSDGQYANAYSADLFSTLWTRLRDQGWSLVNADLTLLAQIPKLAPHREAMRQKLAELFGCPPQSCNVKATTTEGLGFVGEKRGMAAHAVVLLQRTGRAQ